MQEFLSAIQSGASGDELEAIPLPESYRAAFVLRDEVGMFDGLDSEDKDPRKSLHVSEVAVPELAPDEAYVAVMASSINFNTVWTSIFEPLPTFGFLDRLGKESKWGKRHALDYHVVGSDAAGVVLRTGLGRPPVEAGGQGHRPLQLRRRPEPERPRRLDPGRQSADLGVRDQLRRPGRPGRGQGQPADAQAHAPDLGGGGRQRPVQLDLVPDAGVEERRQHAQGDKVLVWGASGGLGAYAVQYVLNGGGTPVGVVSSPAKVELLHDLGVEAVIDRKVANYRFWKDEHTQDESEWRRLGKDIRGLVGDDVDIVFEHPGRQTMGASVFAAKRGGTIVTCAATSGYMIEYDNRHLWMKLKTIKGSHFANYREAWDANQLVCEGKILPPLSAVHTLEHVGDAAYQVHQQPPRGQDRGAVPGARGGAGHRRPRAPGPGGRGPDHPVPEARGMRGPPMTAPLLTEIDHVAIAVNDLEAAIAYYAETFGATVDHRERSTPTAWRRRC